MAWHKIKRNRHEEDEETVCLRLFLALSSSSFFCSDVKMDIFNFAQVRKSANVMGVIRGSVEPGESPRSPKCSFSSTGPCCQSLVSFCVCVSADRYVIYGNHRDSWVHGAIDPSSGTSVMLELSRVLGQKVKEGEAADESRPESLFCSLTEPFSVCAPLCGLAGRWRPRRSIIFGSWGAEEFGLIGSAEYVEVDG